MRFSKIFCRSIIFVITILGVYFYNSQLALALSAPTGLKATCSSDGKTVTLSWNSVPGASYYSIRVDDTTQGINDNPCLGTLGDYCNETVYGTSITVPIRPGDSYRWWVHARDSAGNWSDAAIGYFQCSQLSAPTGLQSFCSSDGKTVVLSWNPVPGASYYSIRVDDTTQGINDNPCQGTTGDYCNEYVYQNSANVRIRPGDSYRWWVHARDSAGNWSDAAIGYFKCSSCSCTPWVNQGCGEGNCPSNYMYQTRTCTPSGCDVMSRCTYDSSCAYVPSPPTGLSYTCNNNGTVTIRWDPVSSPLPGGTIHYAVRLDRNPPTWDENYWSTHCTDSGSWYFGDYCQNNIAGTSITFNIDYNVSYDFWIHSIAIIGSTGYWGDPSHLYFTCSKIPPSPPSNLNAQCSSDGKKVTLSWTGTGVKYALRLDKNPYSWDEERWISIGCNGWDSVTGDYCKDFVYSQTITLDVEPNTQYMWWVHSIDNTGTWSPDSLSYFKCVPSPPPSECSCTLWVNQGCGKDGCTSNQMYQTRTCTPSGCDVQSQCVYDSSCAQPSCSCTPWVNQGCGKDGCVSNEMYRTRTCTPSGCQTESECVYDSTCAQPPPSPPTNNPPSATNLKVTSPDYCELGPGATIFSWTFTDPDGDSQSAYQVQIDNNSNFSSPEVDSGKINSSSNSYSPQTGLNYNTTYYWRVKVWDSRNGESSWSNVSSFTTPKHAWPTPAFTFSPGKPQPGQAVQFTDKSQAFGGTTIKSWSWTFQDGNPSQSTQQNPTVTFSSYGQKQVTLKVVDSDNLGPCSTSTIINLKKALPWWELLFNPSFWFKKISASLRELFY
jgi:hypothetical protein